MKLVAGLGNPGKEYEGTPHNVGFQVVDILLKQLGLSEFQQKFHRILMHKNQGMDYKEENK